MCVYAYIIFIILIIHRGEENSTAYKICSTNSPKYMRMRVYEVYKSMKENNCSLYVI